MLASYVDLKERPMMVATFLCSWSLIPQTAIYLKYPYPNEMLIITLAHTTHSHTHTLSSLYITLLFFLYDIYPSPPFLRPLSFCPSFILSFYFSDRLYHCYNATQKSKKAHFPSPSLQVHLCHPLSSASSHNSCDIPLLYRSIRPCHCVLP